MNLFQKQVLLNVKSGILELHTREVLESGKEETTKRVDERILLKDNVVELPIGEQYLEEVKNGLLLHKS